MNLALLTTLKEKLIHAQEFKIILEYFFDHFGEDPSFMALGERTHHPFLEAVLPQIGRQLFGREVVLTNLLLTSLPEYHFIHGACTLNGKLANVLYFDDIHMGLLAVAMSMTSGETKFARFSGYPMRSNNGRKANGKTNG